MTPLRLSTTMSSFIQRTEHNRRSPSCCVEMTQQGLVKENLEGRPKTKMALLVSPIPLPLLQAVDIKCSAPRLL